jgi:hypothetical protein
MTDMLNMVLQKLEKKYVELSQAAIADGIITPDEQRVLTGVKEKIDDLRQKTQAIDAQRLAGSIKAQGDTKDEKKLKIKGAFEAGAVKGLHAQVKCEVGDPTGAKQLYPVKLTVSFKASSKDSGSGGKGVKIGAESERTSEKIMVLTHHLSVEELGKYVAGLQAASKGSMAGGKFEHAIIFAGVTQGWAVAQHMWESGKKNIAKSLNRPGDSIQADEKSSKSDSANAEVGPIGGSSGKTNKYEKNSKTTVDDKGDLRHDSKTTHNEDGKNTGSLNAGVVGLEAGSTNTVETSFGFSITIYKKHDPDGKILDWLQNCTRPEHYRVFIAANHGKITVNGETTALETGEGTPIGVSIGGVKGNIGTNQGFRQETERDGKGNLVKQRFIGKAGAGGEIPLHSDSEQQEAVAEIDGEGEASVTLTNTKKDGSSVDKAGLRLSNEDLAKLGQVAVNSMDAWMGWTRRTDEVKDWRAAGEAIRRAGGKPPAVAEHLARFVGGDRVERLKTVQKFARGGYASKGIGQKFEFPETIKRLQAGYETVTGDALINEFNKLVEKKDFAAAIDKGKSVIAIIDQLDPLIRRNEDFENRDTKMEMLRLLVLRRGFVANYMKKWAGDKKSEEDPALLEQAADRLQKQLSSYSTEQAKLGGKLYDLIKGQPNFRQQDMEDARELVRQLKDMHRRWEDDYMSMKQTMAKRGVPNWEMPLLEPDKEMLKRYEKAARL